VATDNPTTFLLLPIGIGTAERIISVTVFGLSVENVADRGGVVVCTGRGYKFSLV
jgi:hypothetical protein